MPRLRRFRDAPARNRTWNLRIKSPLLCQLSYRGSRTPQDSGRSAARSARGGGGRRAAGRLPEPAIDQDIGAFVAERVPDHVDYTGWKRIDAHERALGEPHGRPRIKLTDVAEMLEVARR